MEKVNDIAADQENKAKKDKLKSLVFILVFGLGQGIVWLIVAAVLSPLVGLLFKAVKTGYSFGYNLIF